MPNPTNPRLPTWQDRVRTCDNLLGRISFVWEVRVSRFKVQGSKFYFRVSFGIPSPYFDHWAVYRQHEVTVITALDAAPEVKKSIVNSMRPKIPKLPKQ
jgi:hypothetical protein